jgi:hypothetical protein
MENDPTPVWPFGWFTLDGLDDESVAGMMERGVDAVAKELVNRTAEFLSNVDRILNAK